MNIKRLTVLFTLLLSFTAFATAISQADLDHVNDYIASLIHDDDDSFEIKILSANRLENGKLSSIEVKSTDDLLSANGSIDLNEKNVKMGMSLTGNTKDLFGTDLDRNYRMMIVEMINNYVEMFNDLNLYKVSFNYNETESDIQASITVLPISPDAESINAINIEFAVNLATGETTGAVKADFNALSGIVEKGQLGLTNIFESLLRNQEPEEEDLELLLEVFNEVLENVNL